MFVRTLATFAQLYVFANVQLGRSMALFGAASIVLSNLLAFLLLGESLSLDTYLGLAWLWPLPPSCVWHSWDAKAAWFRLRSEHVIVAPLHELPRGPVAWRLFMWRYSKPRWVACAELLDDSALGVGQP